MASSLSLQPPLFNVPAQPVRSAYCMVDLSRSLTRTSLVLAVLIVLGWFSTATDTSQLMENAWFLLLLIIPLAAYYLLRDRVRNIPPLEEAQS
jgi:hypothetical protein